MSAHRVIGKHIFRASIVSTQMGIAADGTPQIVQQPGPMERLEVGALLHNVRPDELVAFGDRLELLSDEDVAAEEAAQQVRADAQRHATAQAVVTTAEEAAVAAHQVAEMQEAEAQDAAKAADAADVRVKTVRAETSQAMKAAENTGEQVETDAEAGEQAEDEKAKKAPTPHSSRRT